MNLTFQGITNPPIGSHLRPSNKAASHYSPNPWPTHSQSISTKVSNATNAGLVILNVAFFLSGVFFSFYFHFFTIALLFINIVNFFYCHVQTEHTLLRNFGILGQARYLIEKPIIISAMCYGALGNHAIRALARGAHQAGIPMNTGEGGYPKYHLEEEGDLIYQIGTAKFGVSDAVSPRHHSECTDITSTVAFIGRIQSLVDLPVGIILCLGSFTEFEDFVLGMKEQNIFPDWITVDGAEGGTGAAPQAFMDRVGVPLYPALHTVNTILRKHGVRDRMRVLASGKLITPSKQIIAIALGADAVYSARGFMLALGCIQALQCGNNTCPIGITTHDPSLQAGLVPAVKAVRIKNYVHNTVHDLQEHLAASGKNCLSELSIDNLYVPADSTLAPFLNTVKAS
jgi:glutamate synthase domain-containing protein 2